MPLLQAPNGCVLNVAPLSAGCNSHFNPRHHQQGYRRKEKEKGEKIEREGDDREDDHIPGSADGKFGTHMFSPRSADTHPFTLDAYHLIWQVDEILHTPFPFSILRLLPGIGCVA
jgi:hypothetical protein